MMNLAGIISNVLVEIERVAPRITDESSSNKGAILTELIEGFFIMADTANKENNSIIDLTEYNEKLTTLLNAFELQDFDLMANILVYEIKPLIEYWKDSITEG